MTGHRLQVSEDSITDELFVREGAQVAITGRDEARLKRARAKLGGAITTIQADVRNSEDMKRMARQVAEAFGDDGLDVFFGNAGVAFSTPLLTTDEARFDELLAVNVKGALLLHASRDTRAARWGVGDS